MYFIVYQIQNAVMNDVDLHLVLASAVPLPEPYCAIRELLASVLNPSPFPASRHFVGPTFPEPRFRADHYDGNHRGDVYHPDSRDEREVFGIDGGQPDNQAARRTNCALDGTFE